MSSNKPGNKPPAGKPQPAKPAAGKASTTSKPAAANAAAKPPERPAGSDYQIGDEISFAAPHGMDYGTVIKIIKDPASPAIEVEFEDGRKEIKKVRDRALRLLRRASGKSEVEEQRGDRKRLRDTDIEDVIRSEKRRGSRH